VTTQLSGTSVTFDGQAAPMIYADTQQISAMVPFGIAGRTATQLVVQYGTRSTDPLPLAVVPASPGIFTADGRGAGQVVAMNEDYSSNSFLHPARAGTALTIFATGVSSSRSEAFNWRFSRPLADNITATINSVPAEILEGGPATALIPGVVQIRVRIPLNVPPGSAIPIQVKVDEAPSQDGATVAVR
jgi:uncharacterized protein (TIGR03437 family)